MVQCRDDAGYPTPNFGGKGVRIRAYWTRPIWSIPEVYQDSWDEIRMADQLLRRETLSLDVEPGLMDLPPIVPKPNSSKLLEQFSEPYLRPRQRPAPAKSPRPNAFLEFDEILDLTNDKELTEDFFKPLRSLVDLAPPKENRLIVVFTPLKGTVTDNLAEIQGYTIRRSTTKLPWVLVDPRELDSYTLLHEIGHACRLAHRRGTIMGQGEAMAAPVLYDMQVHAIYNSYWCAGSRPRNWWSTLTMSQIGGPWLWYEDS